MLRRAAFNVLGSNNDDHTKNHSFLMDEHGEWSLSPGYDITWAYDPGNRWLRRHLMSVEGKFEDITRSDLETFADRFDVPDYRSVLDRVVDAIAGWPTYAADAGVSTARADEFSARLTALAAGAA